MLVVKYDLMAQALSVDAWLPAHRGRGIRVHEAGLDELLSKQAPNRSPEKLRAQFEAGVRSLLAELDGEFVGFLWVINGGYV